MKMSKRAKTIIVFILSCTLLMYLGASFIQWSFDLSKMDEASREGGCLIWFFIVVIGSAAIYCLKDDD